MTESNNAINNTVGADISGVTNILTVTNPSNTVSSAAKAHITVGGAASDDPWLNWSVSGVTEWSMGIDNGNSDELKVSQAGTIGSNDTWIMTTVGERTMPLQPSFFAYAGSNVANVTGDGTLYYLGDSSLGASLTTVFDQASNFTSGAAGGAYFTCPVDGVYHFNTTVQIGFLSAAHAAILIYFLIDTFEILGPRFNPVNIRENPSLTSFVTQSFSSTYKCTAGQTVKVGLEVDGGAKTAGIEGGASPIYYTHFSGFLVH